MPRQVVVFDTTLRDGEQSPGCSMNIREKIELARQLELLRVDVIEAGFAIASPGDFEAVRRIAQNVREPVVASLSRALTKDIDRSAEALKDAKRPRIHVFLATSDIHIEYKLKSTREEVLRQAAEMTAYARKFCDDVEFSAEDALRSDREFLRRVCEAAIGAGARTVNIPDTVGYTTPQEMFELIEWLVKNVDGIDRAALSTHCHNDLGMAVANTLAAVQAGASQVECTVNGIGERAGNAALEEVVMALKTRPSLFGAACNVDTTQLYPASRLLSTIISQDVQPNKAVVGANAFAHEAGIHQHGVLANRATYEIMSPEAVGIPKNKMILGKHSGRHALEERLRDMGYALSKETLDRVAEEFKKLADFKKEVDDRDLEALVEPHLSNNLSERYAYDRFVVNSGNTISATAIVRVMHEGEPLEQVSTGDGPIDAAFKAIDKIVGTSFTLESYRIHSATEGQDALGVADVRLSSGGRQERGRGTSTDILEASIKAYLNAVNRFMTE
jgi:2-isopropylmalate synthase